MQTVIKNLASITLNFDKPDLTSRCLSAIANSSLVPEKIILIDNGSSEVNYSKVRNLTLNFEPEIIRLPKNIGVPGALNLGVRKSIELGMDFLLVIHNDVEIQPNCIEVMMDCMKSNPNLAALSARQVYKSNPNLVCYDGARLTKFGFIPVMIGRGKPLDVNERPKKEVLQFNKQVLELTTCIIRSKAITDIGLFQESLQITWEDIEWSIRASRSDWEIGHSTHAVVLHEFGATIGTGYTRDFFEYNVRNHRYVNKVHGKRLDMLTYYVYWIWKFFKYLASGNRSYSHWIIRTLLLMKK